jgi:hypothetical protein
LPFRLLARIALLDLTVFLNFVSNPDAEVNGDSRSSPPAPPYTTTLLNSARQLPLTEHQREDESAVSPSWPASVLLPLR